METVKIYKWGNSQGIRIPKKLIKKLDLRIDDELIIEEKDNHIELKKIETEKVSLEKLFKNYDEEYEKINFDWDNKVGKEIW